MVIGSNEKLIGLFDLSQLPEKVQHGNEKDNLKGMVLLKTFFVFQILLMGTYIPLQLLFPIIFFNFIVIDWFDKTVIKTIFINSTIF